MNIKRLKPLLRLVLVAVIGAILASFGLNLSEDRIDQAIDSILDSNQTSTTETVDFKADATLKVLSVIDGDTVVVEVDTESVTVRILGINTPETVRAPQSEQCYGIEATNEAKRLLENTLVTLETDSTQATYDKYNRLLAYVSLADGRDFGEVMIHEGFAYEYTYLDREYKKQAIYKNAQVEAKDNKRGLWSVCN